MIFWEKKKLRSNSDLQRPKYQNANLGMINGEKCYPYFTLRFFNAIYNNIETIVFSPLSPLRNRNEHNRVANECFKETFLRRKVGESKRVFSKEGRTSPRIPPFKAHSHFPRKSDESSLGVGEGRGGGGGGHSGAFARASDSKCCGEKL